MNDAPSRSALLRPWFFNVLIVIIFAVAWHQDRQHPAACFPIGQSFFTPNICGEPANGDICILKPQ